MRHLMSPLDFSVQELDQLLDLASDIEKHPGKYAHACDGKKACSMNLTELPDSWLSRRKSLPFFRR